METSIIIRTKNEEKWLGKVLERLSEQTYKDFEIVIVDSGSTDKTLEIARKFDTKIFQIKPEEFSYPYALNFGCEKAQATKYFVFLSAHSLPISKTWLEDGIKDFADEKIMGVYGMMQALPDGSWIEKLTWNSLYVKINYLLNTKRVVRSLVGGGVMAFTHAIIRKDLWLQHKIDESYGLGGEDQVWAKYWFDKGYVAIQDVKFSVAHSHGLGLIRMLQQVKHWKETVEPHPYKRPSYRK
jgi:rhamnosyltransferase